MVGAGLVDAIATREFRAGSIYGNVVGEASSIGTAEIANNAVTMAKASFLIQSGTYTTDGAETFTTFAAAFSAAPKVVVSPTQAAGIETPLVTSAAAGSFAVSGAAAHTGAYLAFGLP